MICCSGQDYNTAQCRNASDVIIFGRYAAIPCEGKESVDRSSHGLTTLCTRPRTGAGTGASRQNYDTRFLRRYSETERKELYQ